MNCTTKRYLALAAAAAMSPLVSRAATTGFNQTGGGPWSYTDTGNWVGGTINNIWDSSLTLGAAQTVTLNSDLAVSSPMAFNYLGNFALTVRADGGDRVLTLGGDVTDNTGSTVTVTIGSFTGGQRLAVDLGGATRTFDVSSSGNRVLNLRNGITSTSSTTAGIIKNGTGGLQIEAASTYSGQSVINGGTYWMGSSGGAANSDAIVNAGGNLRFDNSGSGNTSLTRIKSVTLNGGNITLSSATSTSVNTNDVITNALAISAGGSLVSMRATPLRHMRLTAGSFTRDAGGVVLFRGTSLGLNELSSSAAGATNIVFNAAPDLVGATGGTGTTTRILRGAYGATSPSGSGEGLVTYDSTHGLRLLTEYKTSITDGQTDLDNVRLTGITTGAGPVQTSTLSATTTTLNSLSLIVSGTPGNAGVTVTGTDASTLKLNSGVIYASQSLSAVGGSSDYITINGVNLDLNGGEGVIIANTANVTNGTAGALVRIDSKITNDGGQGVTFGGTGAVMLGGATANDYTGDTYVSGAQLWLTKTGEANAIGGNLVLLSGTVLNQGNQIGDDKDITIRGGTLHQRRHATNSGSGTSETFRDLLMTGGTYNDGSSGTSSGTTNLRNATINGGSWAVTAGHKTNLSGSLAMGGGAMSITRANDTTRTTVVTVNGDLDITNTASGAYTPIAMTGGNAANVEGGELVLKGDVTFTGNAANANTVNITAAAPTSGGGAATVSLVGTRTFDIGNGAAADDLAIAPVIGGAGGLVKTGHGTLVLSGVNTYSGGTVVNGGVLRVSGTLGSGAVSVDGATLELTNATATAIGDNADLALSADGDVFLNFTGSETVGALVLDGVTHLSGMFNASTHGDYFSGGGNIVATPEPASLGLLVLAGGGLMARRRRSM